MENWELHALGFASIVTGVTICAVIWMFGRWSEPKIKDDQPAVKRWWAASDSD